MGDGPGEVREGGHLEEVGGGARDGRWRTRDYLHQRVSCYVPQFLDSASGVVFIAPEVRGALSGKWET